MSFAHQAPYKFTYTSYDDLEEEEEEEEGGEEEEEVDFQTGTLDDNHWTMDEIPDRHLCIHKQSLPHSLCPYPHPYIDYTPASYHSSLDLSDFSDLEDVLITSSDEDVPVLDDMVEL